VGGVELEGCSAGGEGDGCGGGEEVVFEVGLDCQTVKKIILEGALSEKLLNTIITSYNKEENTVSL
jgi:hypothetical protein